MVNYQLYRSNVLLGGQMKWDIILGENGGVLEVQDFHLSPISRRIPYNKLAHEDLVRYTHEENVRDYYSKISRDFYEEYGNPKMQSPNPLNEICSKPYDDTFEMGCRRLQYQVYGKQFEFFCPIWLEQISENQCLNFEFEIKTESHLETVYKRNLKFSRNLLNTYHDRFIQYIENYFLSSGLKDGNDRLINIDLKKGRSTITGLQVSTGLNGVTADTSTIGNMIHMENLLMIADSLIINPFKEQKLITNQLFNFNFCFNIPDIVPDFILNLLRRDPFIISVNVSIIEIENGNEFEEPLKLVDFYSNYEYIPRKYIGPVKYISVENDEIKEEDPCDALGFDRNEHREQLNVLSYLKDNKSVNLMNKNKMIQSIIHWSLTTENDYVFNVYPGFGGYYLNRTDKNKELGVVVVPLRYDNTPDIWGDIEYDQNKNNVGWCNMLNITKLLDVDDFESLVNYVTDIISLGSKYSTKFKPLVRANHILCPEIGVDYEFNIISLLGQGETHHNKFDVCCQTIGDLEGVEIYYGNHINIIKCYKNIVFYASDIKYLTFKNIINVLYELNLQPMSELGTLITVLEKMTLEQPSALPILYSLTPVFDNKILSTTEVTHIPHLYNLMMGIPNIPQVVLRDGGCLRPTFVMSEADINYNYMYKKRNLLEMKDQERLVFKELLGTGISPVYPSIGYTSTSCEIQMYDKQLAEKYLSSQPEYNSFNVNKVIWLDASIDCVLDSDVKSIVENGIANYQYKTIDELVREYLGEYYKTNGDEVLLNYICGLYEYDSKFEYKYDENGYPIYHHIDGDKMFTYQYDIQLRLK